MSNENQLSISDMQNIGAEAEKMARRQSGIDRVIGMAQMAEYFGKMATVANLNLIKSIKESKEYEGYIHFFEDGTSRRVANFGELCEFVFKKSRRSVDESLLNLDRLGGEFLERANEMGLNQRLINRASRLDQEDRQVIIEVVQQADSTKEQVIEAFEQLMEKNARAKQKLEEQNTQLTAKLEDVTGDLESVRKISAEKTKHLDEAREQLERTRRQIADADPEAVGEELRLSLSAVQVSIESEMTKLRPLLDQLIEHGQANFIDHTPTIVGCLNQIIRNCEYLRESYHLPQESPTDEVPAWVKAMQDEGKVN